MSLAPGQSLSHYRLTEPIGEGGMGVVWKALDTTLGRDVALKFLPAPFADDPERLARFEREARLLASLNHPAIASIYGFQAAAGVHFLAMELVEGEDLAQRLRRGAVPVPEALAIARRIAEALEAAHEKGIVHRDLKPANVKLGADGAVKVLDFGLARALEGDRSSPSGANLTQSPTITAAMTSANVILGTAAYMSPEQARGQTVDRRADIWAFGVVLYEMLTGRQLFEGETVSDTLAAVLKTEPDWSLLPPATPARVRTLLRRCLERQAKLRLRDIGEARILLDEVLSGKEAEPAATPSSAAAPPSRPGPLPWIVAAAAALAAVGFAAMALLRPAAPGVPLRRFQLHVPAGSTAAPALASISPDGRTVAYFVGDTLWAQPLDALEPHRLATADAPGRAMFWSPDSRQVGYISGTRIFKVPLDGGGGEVVCDARGAFTGGSGASWRDDGTILFSRGEDDGILQVPAAGGDAQTLVKIDPKAESDLHEPWALPGGRGVLFCSHRLKGGFDNIGLWSGGKRKVVLELPGQQIWHPVYTRSGHILFRRAGTNPGIWALPFSLARLAATGAPFLVESGATDHSVSDEGSLVFLGGSAGGLLELAFYDRTGATPRIIGQAALMDHRPALSPDGRRVVLAITEGDHRDLWIQDVARGTRTRLTFDPGDEYFASWSPDGQWIVYQAAPPTYNSIEQLRVLMRRADGTGGADTLASGGSPNFTPDGRSVTFARLTATAWDLQVVDLAGDRKPRTFLAANNYLSDPRVSPHGSLIAYMSQESGEWQVYLKRYPSGEGKWQVSTSGGEWPRWDGSGGHLYYVQGVDLLEVEVTGTDTPVLGTPHRLLTGGSSPGAISRFLPAFDVSADGRTFIGTVDATGGPAAYRPAVTVVQNWLAAFERRK